MTKQHCLDLLNKALPCLAQLKEFRAFWNKHADMIHDGLRLIVVGRMGTPDDDASKITEKFASFDANIESVTTEMAGYKGKIEAGGEDVSPRFYSFFADNFMASIAGEFKTWVNLWRQFASQQTEAGRLLCEDGTLSDAQHALTHPLTHFEELVVSMTVLMFSAVEDIRCGLPLVRVFYALKQQNSPIVLIGPNGCGKSTFARAVSQNLGLGAAVIPAQKIFVYDSAPPSLQDNYAHVKSYLRGDKLGKSESLRQGGNERRALDVLVKQLIYERIEQIDEERNKKRKRGELRIEKIMRMWGEIIPHRRLVYDSFSLCVAVPETDDACYRFMDLSDGEKAVFYYIASVMLAPPGYVIVDEPENHLNLAVVNRLWDMLEHARRDCQFIYLTHNPDFAAGRGAANVLWVDDFSPIQGEFRYTEIGAMDEIDTRLMVELVGSRKDILFCEGTKSSLDYRVYSVLFPEFTVVPVDGCGAVINHTRTYNNTSKYFKHSARGIVDLDFRTADDILRLAESSVHCLPFPAVENLLCCAELIEAAATQYLSSPEKVKTVKNDLVKALSRKKAEMAVLHAHSAVRAKMEKGLPGKPSSLQCLLDACEKRNVPSSEEIEAIYAEKLAEIESAVDYEAALGLYHDKSVITIPNKIIDHYNKKVIDLLRNDKGLRQRLREKYFGALVPPDANTKPGKRRRADG